MKKRSITIFIIFTILTALMPQWAVSADGIEIGDYVQMGIYNNNPILWRCVDIDDNGPLMLSDRIICLKAYDAKTSNNNITGSHGREQKEDINVIGPNGKIMGTARPPQFRTDDGSNYWADSNIRSWLNSNAPAGKVEWLCGNPPTEENLKWSFFKADPPAAMAYDQESGFLTNFTDSEIKTIKDVTQRVMVSALEHENWSYTYSSGIKTSGSENVDVTITDDIEPLAEQFDNAYAEHITDKMFLLNVKQLNAVKNNSSILGKGYYIGKLMEGIVGDDGLRSGELYSYWLNLTDSFWQGSDVWIIEYTGTLLNKPARMGSIGVRPAFYIADTTSFISGSGTEGDPYIIDNTSKATNKVKTSFGAAASDWAVPEIELAFENNLIPEVMLNFDLTRKVNRGEFAAIALQLYDTLTKSETKIPSSCPFTDILDDINEDAIKKAYSLDIAAGTSENKYEPVTSINREQLATMLCRTIKKYNDPKWTLKNDDDYILDTNGAKLFADDADISDWAKPSVYFMTKHEIIYGLDNTHFAPKNTTSQQEASGYATATREQAILLTQRIFDKADILGKIN